MTVGQKCGRQLRLVDSPRYSPDSTFLVWVSKTTSATSESRPIGRPRGSPFLPEPMLIVHRISRLTRMLVIHIINFHASKTMVQPWQRLRRLCYLILLAPHWRNLNCWTPYCLSSGHEALNSTILNTTSLPVPNIHNVSSQGPIVEMYAHVP